MSHITTVKSQMNDADAIRAAIESISGATLLENAVPRYYGTQYGGSEASHCEFVLQLPGRYDLGLKQQSDGSFSFVCDTELLFGAYGANDAGRKLLGDDAGAFRQAYSIERVRLHARRHGHTFNQERQADGTVKLVLG